MTGATSGGDRSITIGVMKSARPRLMGLGLLGTLVLAACSSSSTAAETTLSPSATPWRTLPPVSATEIPTSATLPSINYTVQRGDFSNSIAKKAGGGCSGADILAANPGVTTLNPGDVIAIPANCLGAGITEEILNSGPADTLPPGKTTTTTTEAKYAKYTIVAGDFWYKIASKTGCTVKQLKAANTNVKSLHPGNDLRVPLSCYKPKK